MEDKFIRKTYNSLGVKQIIYPVYQSSFNILITIEEGYSSKGYKKPILVIERGIIKRTKNSTPIFKVIKPIYVSKFKDLHIKKVDRNYLKRYLSVPKYNELIDFIKREKQDVEKYNDWLNGDVNNYSNIPKPIDRKDPNSIPIFSKENLI